MAKYRNIKTGFIFETTCILNGEDWEEIPNSTPKKEVVEDEKPKAKRTKK